MGRGVQAGSARGRHLDALNGPTGSRPLWLLDEPQPCSSPLEFEEGCECLESGWWDGQDISRDYFIARNRQGMRLWVFRNRRDTDPRGWFVHGYFG